MWCNSSRRYQILITSVSTLLLVLLVLALLNGAVPISIADVWAWFGGAHDTQALILQQIRLPRVLLAAVVGALLALTGAVAQALFRNPLADPSLIGVSAGAAMGAGIAIVLLPTGLHQSLGLSLVSCCAFIGALATVLLVYLFAQSVYGTSVSTLLLAGLGIAFLAASVTGLLEFFADQQKLKHLSLWRMGALDGANFSQLGIIVSVAICVLALVWVLAPSLDILLLGEAEASHLGLEVNRVKLLAVLAIAAGVAVSVALAGTIAFVGLVVPHICRALVGPKHRWLLPLCGLLGAVFVVLADLLARVLLAPVELPAGLLIALIGAPMFLFMLRRRYQYHG